MEAQIVEGNIGTVGKYDIEFVAGNLVIGMDTNVGVGIALKIKAEAVLTAIAKAIPGQIDDAVINVIKAALLK